MIAIILAITLMITPNIFTIWINIIVVFAIIFSNLLHLYFYIQQKIKIDI
jgi:membrane protein implicated in regulation of membrane protease activity